MNTFISPLTGFSPYEMVFCRRPPPISDLERSIEYAQTQTTEPTEYMNLMKAKLKRMKSLIVELKLAQQQEQKIRDQFQNEDTRPIQVGDLVMVHKPRRGGLLTNRRNIGCPWVGPAVVVGMPTLAKFLITDFMGKLLPVLVGRREVKLYNARQINPRTNIVKTSTELVDVLNELRLLQKEANPDENV